MAERVRNNLKKDVSVLDNLQNTICNTLYRMMFKTMGDLKIESLEISIDDYVFTARQDFNNKERLVFRYKKNKSSEYSTIDVTVDFSKTINSDPFFVWLNSRFEFKNKRTEIYDKWIDAVTDKTLELIKEEQKFNKLITKIYDIPFLTTSRKVLIEKI